MRSTVYFTRDCTSEAVVRLYRALGKELTGNVAVKVHTGEEGNQNFLTPAFWKPTVDLVGGTVVECNTAYGGARNETSKHQRLLKDHGWDALPFELLDAEGPDDVLPVRGGLQIHENYVGKAMKNYDAMLVLAHFKGHPMGGYGGALKQISIGTASTAGKCWIHSAGKTLDQSEVWGMTAPQNAFLEAMADAALSIVDFFKGNMAFVNVMKNMSVDCDCCAVAEDPCLADIGVAASLDPVAVDRACLDLVMASDDPGKAHFLERVESRNGAHTIEAAEAIGVGSASYDLIEL